MDAIRVLIVDDHPAVREIVPVVLMDEPAIMVVGEATDGQEALGQAADTRPDVVIMDIGMPGLDGVEATRLIRERIPESKVVVLTIRESTYHLNACLQAGAQAYVVKRSMAQELVQAIDAVANGSMYVSPSLSSLPAQ